MKLAYLSQNLYRRSEDDVTYSLVNDRPTTGSQDYSRANPSPYNQLFRQYSGNLDWRVPFGTITSQTGYSTESTNLHYDYTSAGLGVAADAASMGAVKSADLFYAGSTDKFTQELRLTSPDSGKLRYIVGGFYTHEDTGLEQAVNPLTASGATYLPLNPTILYNIPTTYQEYAFFANGTYSLTDRIELGGGVRYSHNNQTFRESAVGVIASMQGLTVSIPTTPSREGVVTYSATAKYKLNAESNIYFRA